MYVPLLPAPSGLPNFRLEQMHFLLCLGQLSVAFCVLHHVLKCMQPLILRLALSTTIGNIRAQQNAGRSCASFGGPELGPLGTFPSRSFTASSPTCTPFRVVPHNTYRRSIHNADWHVTTLRKLGTWLQTCCKTSELSIQRHKRNCDPHAFQAKRVGVQFVRGAIFTHSWLINVHSFCGVGLLR